MLIIAMALVIVDTWEKSDDRNQPGTARTLLRVFTLSRPVNVVSFTGLCVIDYR
jgi:hypothetical protein